MSGRGWLPTKRFYYVETSGYAAFMLDRNKCLRLSARVLLGAYYTDGKRLYETDSIGATGCVVFRDCCTDHHRCLSIEDFRARLWLVKPAAAQAA